jgi:paraquat-inducible protein B
MMIEQNSNKPDFEEPPEAVVRTRRQFSIVWVVPLVAALIGAWLAYRAISEMGPTINITFKSAAGLEVGKTKIKYKDVEVGNVEAIGFTEDLSRVIVTAKLIKGAKPYLTEYTRFWVVRPQITAGGVSGLGTLFSGAYIAIDPGKEGVPAREFKGLEIPPVVTTDMPGRHFLLRATRLGSLDIGSPIYYRQIQAGKVVRYELDEDGQALTIKVFINAPHHERVRKNTLFWHASGLDVKVDASGIRIDTESLVTIMMGGIAFDVPTDLETSEPSGPAEEGDVFRLHESRESIYEKTYAQKKYFVLHFNESEVIEIKAEFKQETLTPRIEVLIETEPERWEVVGEVKMDEGKQIERLVEKGLRAQLKTGSLLTGQLFVDLDFHPDAPFAQVIYGERYRELPTIPAPLQQITARVNQLLNKLEKLPIEQIGNDLRDTLKHTKLLVQNLDSNFAPAVSTTLEQAQKTLASVESVLDSESPSHHELKRALKELAEAARAIRILADYLERHPEALIKGKGTSQ